jgi:hypothetical protein
MFAVFSYHQLAIFFSIVRLTVEFTLARQDQHLVLANGAIPVDADAVWPH